MRNILLVPIFVLMFLFVSLVNVAIAKTNVPQNATTTTNVCVIYSVNGILSGGVPVISPDTVSYRYNGVDGIFLWLPNQDRLTVDTLSLTPMIDPTQCVGPL